MDYAKELAKLSKHHEDARAKVAAVERERDDLIRAAHHQGKMTMRDIASYVGVSHQRVVQILNG